MEPSSRIAGQRSLPIHRLALDNPNLTKFPRRKD
jgi:hypothetical protein